MTIDDFRETLVNPTPPTQYSVLLQALWYDAKGDWKSAHDLVDELDGTDAARIHAYLHRVEGDLWNARYWYGMARDSEFEGPLEDEWMGLFQRFS